MKIQQPSFEIWDQEPGIDGAYRQIERAGRVCYKSEDHRTAESARPFVERMIKSDHTAMLEHGTVYLMFADINAAPDETWRKYERNKFSKVVSHVVNHYVTTNLRVLVENGWMDDLAFWSEPQPAHERRITVHFTTQIGTTREFNRHRANSMAEQSTRYCNYGKSKFGNEITVNLPVWVSAEMSNKSDFELPSNPRQIEELFRKVMAGTATDLENWVFSNLIAERAYMNLTAAGRKPQEARAVLPLDTNTELVHTALVSQWNHFFDLRARGTTGAPHPDAKVLAQPLMEEFQRRGLIE